MKEEILRKLITLISEDYIETLLTGIKEYEKDFPYTIACANFMSELKSKNIIVDYYKTFEVSIRDMVYREASNYLAR
ncbi:hypothetical protein [Romboutsia ilealis]|uniref:hypothetical protein n=1 Tax=Romboutsia ilealis TaxID=1115758 RepID=UPI0024940A44|nr:hypothetical protein [Romboutsia ilealis]